LAWLEPANFAIRYGPQIKSWYQRKLRRCGVEVSGRWRVIVCQKTISFCQGHFIWGGQVTEGLGDIKI
jgi:hypothetical protein